MFERAVRTLLEPIIEEKSAGGPKYLVNGNVILGCLEFLTKRGYGREPDPASPSFSPSGARSSGR